MKQYTKGRPEWNFLEGIFNRIPLAYPIISLIIALLIFLIYSIFMFVIKIEDFQYDPYFCLQVLFSSAFIAYLIGCNQYIINKIRHSVQKLEFIPGKEKYGAVLYDLLEKNFTKSKRYYILIFAVILPFILKDLLEIYILKSATYEECFFSDPFFNVYNYSIFFFSLYLLTNTVWIILNISKILCIAAREPYASIIKLDIFCPDKIGGLGEMRSFIINIIIYYSIGISLAVLAYVDPSGFRTVLFEVAFLILLLAAGLVILISGLQELQKLFRKRVEQELTQINKKYRILCERLVDLASVESNGKNNDELKFIITAMEFIDKERIKRETLLEDNGKRYSITATFAAIYSFALVLFTLYEKLNNFKIIDLLLNIFSLTFDILVSLYLKLII